MKKLITFLLAILLLIPSILPGYQPIKANQSNKENRIVKVGYFAFAGYHNVDGNGLKSGYGYEYLQKLKTYSGLEYDYIGDEKGEDNNWSDMVNMLINGDIDVLTSLTKTSDRQKDLPIQN